jgi:hypothetical protein
MAAKLQSDVFGWPAIAERGNLLHRRPAADGYLCWCLLWVFYSAD